MDLFNKFKIIIRALNKYDVEYILIGGYAVVLYGCPRTTQDMDLMLNGTDENITRLKDALRSVYNDNLAGLIGGEK
jgi:hypothetical protein